ncbi:hypothetical protein DRV85_06545 [Rhodosalinus halophilus]|uniref:Uncharacterized protein n=1 Tax=Rhodosalinus halophilus TaxID=2259333 RepID=A0A365UBU0_9RHOB|nr:hypothetical protein [Rhodosalinus halophilus]RBI86401.1 hypothetical protein DRV85_06545 [Rhodosalinus halophilus]
MKLSIATIAATVLLTGAATAMTERTSPFHEPRDAALGGNGLVTAGEIVRKDADEFFEPRAKALISAETVDVTVFETKDEEPSDRAIR